MSGSKTPTNSPTSPVRRMGSSRTSTTPSIIMFSNANTPTNSPISPSSTASTTTPPSQPPPPPLTTPPAYSHDHNTNGANRYPVHTQSSSPSFVSRTLSPPYIVQGFIRPTSSSTTTTTSSAKSSTFLPSTAATSGPTATATANNNNNNNNNNINNNNNNNNKTTSPPLTTPFTTPSTPIPHSKTATATRVAALPAPPFHRAPYHMQIPPDSPPRITTRAPTTPPPLLHIDALAKPQPSPELSPAYLYHTGPPQKDAVVWVRVSRRNKCDQGGYVDIDVPAVYVDLLEHGDLVGVIDPNFISFQRKKCISPVKGLKAGKCFAAVVLDVDVKPNGDVFIDLSKKDVTSSQKTRAQCKYDKAIKLRRTLIDASYWATDPTVSTPQHLLARVSHPLHERPLPHGYLPYDYLCYHLRTNPPAARSLIHELCDDEGCATSLMELLASSHPSPPFTPEARSRVQRKSHKGSSKSSGGSLGNVTKFSEDTQTSDADSVDPFQREVCELVHDGLLQLKKQMGHAVGKSGNSTDKKDVLSPTDITHIVKVQLTQLPRAYSDRTGNDVASAALCCLLDHACKLASLEHMPVEHSGRDEGKDEPIKAEIRTVINTWSPMLRHLLDEDMISLTSNDSSGASLESAPKGQVELLLALAEHCRDLSVAAKRPQGQVVRSSNGDDGADKRCGVAGVLPQLFLQVLIIMYEDEVEEEEFVSREAILQWSAYASQQAKADGDDEMLALLARVRAFLRWLAEDDDSDDDDDDDDDD